MPYTDYEAHTTGRRQRLRLKGGVLGKAYSLLRFHRQSRCRLRRQYLGVPPVGPWLPASGFDVYYVEERQGNDLVDEDLKPAPFSKSVNAQSFRRLIDRFELGDRAAFLEAGTSAHVGLSREDIDQIAPDVDLFLNQFGAYTAVLGRVRRSVYLDLDPGHTQIWQEQYGVDMHLRGHDLYLTIGLNMGEPGCPLPTCGVHWEKTLFPIVLSEWATDDSPGPAFTTVASWRDYSWVEWQGVWYAQKAEAFQAVINLPRRVSMPIELCMSIADSDPELPALHANGWRSCPRASGWETRTRIAGIYRAHEGSFRP